MVDVKRRRYNAVATPEPPPAVGRFPGDPGRGNVVMGWSATNGTNANFEAQDAKLGVPVGIVRLFDGGSGTVNWSRVDYHRARGRISAVSVKNSGAGVSDADLAAMNATARTWVDALSEQMLARPALPIPFTVHHEPENDITSDAACETFREGKRQVYHRMRVTNGVDNMVFVDAVYMGGSIPPGQGGDWRKYSVDWKGTSTGGSTPTNPNVADFYTGDYVSLTEGSCTDVVGLDAYCFWGVKGHESTANWVDWDAKKWTPFFNTVKSCFPGKSYAVHEYACAAYCGDQYHVNEVFSEANKQQTWTWMENAYRAMIRDDVVWACWFSALPTATHLDYYDPQQWRYQKLRELIGRSTTVRVPVY